MPKIEVDEELLLKVSKNARLDLSTDEIKMFLPQFEEVLKAFEKLDELDTDKEEPSFQPIPIQNVWREDIEEKSLSQEDALKNTKHKKDGYFKGPVAVE
jgi:aspartyl-tRNA(Asn)/glutamyl-tRNA(Gln) amidotransferase subunit C